MLSKDQEREIYEHQGKLWCLLEEPERMTMDPAAVHVQLIAVSLYLASQTLLRIADHTSTLARWADQNWDLLRTIGKK